MVKNPCSAWCPISVETHQLLVRCYSITLARVWQWGLQGTRGWQRGSWCLGLLQHVSPILFASPYISGCWGRCGGSRRSWRSGIGRSASQASQLACISCSINRCSRGDTSRIVYLWEAGSGTGTAFESSFGCKSPPFNTEGVESSSCRAGCALPAQKAPPSKKPSQT